MAGARRIVVALGAAVAIGLGGVTMVGQQDARAAGVTRPLVVQTSPIAVAAPQSAQERND